MKKFLFTFGIVLMFCFTVGSKIANATDIHGGYIVENLRGYYQIAAIATALRQVADSRRITLSIDDRQHLNLIIHANERASLRGRPNPYYGTTDKRELAKEKLRELVKNYIRTGTLSELQELRDSVQGK